MDSESEMADGGFIYGHIITDAIKAFNDAQRRQAERELESKFREAFESGPAEPMTREDWDSIEREALDRLAREQPTP